MASYADSGCQQCGRASKRSLNTLFRLLKIHSFDGLVNGTMTRCVLSLLLIPLVLASQSLCIPHTHLGMLVVEPEGHWLQPHFHVHRHRENNLAKHSHRHFSHGHTHHHHSTNSTTRRVVPAGFLPNQPHQHDDDAVYLAASLLVSLNRELWQKLGKTFWLDALPAHHDAARIWRAALERSSWSLPPPSEWVCARSPRNLTLRC